MTGPKKLWFKAKRYGYGWYPCTWQGWLIIAAYVALVLVAELLFIRTVNDANGAWLTAVFVLFIAGTTGGLIAICVKTGEKAGWRWGDKK